MRVDHVDKYEDEYGGWMNSEYMWGLPSGRTRTCMMGEWLNVVPTIWRVDPVEEDKDEYDGEDVNG